jgi:hypothetical protein
VLLVLTLLACAAFAQPAVDERNVRQLLSSPALSDRAWGVFWVSRLHLPDSATLLVDQLHSAQHTTSTSDTEEKAFVDAVFDALIEAGVPAPAQLLESFSPGWRDQVLILLARQEGNEDLLLSMRKEELRRQQWTAVNNLLLRNRSPRFFVANLTELTVTHKFVIVDPTESGGGFGGGSGGGGSGCGIRQLPRGFPAIGVYQLTDTPQEGDILLAKGPRDAYYRRTIIPTNMQVGWSTPFFTFDRQEELLGYLGAWNYLKLDDARRIFWPTTTVNWLGAESFSSYAESALASQMFEIQSFVARAQELGARELSGKQLQIASSIEDHRNGGAPSPTLVSPKPFTIP